MATKRRAVSTSDSSKKRGRVARELAGLVEQDGQLQFQADLKELNEQLKANPQRMNEVKAVMKTKIEKPYDKSKEFHPDLKGRNIMRLPEKYLLNDFFKPFDAIPTTDWKCLMKADRKVPWKIFQRATLCLADQPIVTMVREEFTAIGHTRVKLTGFDLKDIKWDGNYNVDWGRCGVFGLHPPMPEGTDPMTHFFTHILFMGVLFEIDPAMVSARGNWTIDKNWSHMEAELVNPVMEWHPFPVHKLIGSKHLANELAQPLVLQLQDGAKHLAIKDMPEDANVESPAPTVQQSAIDLSPSPQVMMQTEDASYGGARPPSSPSQRESEPNTDGFNSPPAKKAMLVASPVGIKCSPPPSESSKTALIKAASKLLLS